MFKFYLEIKIIKKKNLILAISKSEIFHYYITDENTNSDTFIKFLENLKLKIEEKKEKKFALILDNCKAHKTNDIIEYLKNKKISAIFTPPYLSTFTPIELAFRALKRITYSKLYDNIDEIVKDIYKFLNNESTKQTLVLNYKETIQHYLSFYEQN